MLDLKYVITHTEAVKQNCRNRNVTADVDRVVGLDDERKRLISAMQVKQQEANASAKTVGQEKVTGRRRRSSLAGVVRAGLRPATCRTNRLTITIGTRTVIIRFSCRCSSRESFQPA